MNGFGGQDFDDVVRTVLSEAKGEGPMGMAAVAHVIRNRLLDGSYGRTPSAVVRARSQFEPWLRAGKGDANDPLGWDDQSEDYQGAARIVQAVFGGGAPDPTKGAVNFLNPDLQSKMGRDQPDWTRTMTPTTKLGGHQFYSKGAQMDGQNLFGLEGFKPQQTTQAFDMTRASASPMQQQPPGMGGQFSPDPSGKMTGWNPAFGAGPGGGGMNLSPDQQAQIQKLMWLMGQQGQPAQPRSGLLPTLLFGKGGVSNIPGLLGMSPQTQDAFYQGGLAGLLKNAISGMGQQQASPPSTLSAPAPAGPQPTQQMQQPPMLPGGNQFAGLGGVGGMGGLPGNPLAALFGIG